MTPRHFLANRTDDASILSKGAASEVDAVFLDLEDGVAESQKGIARANLVHALGSHDYRSKMTLVRFNDVYSDHFASDLEVIRSGPDAIMLPKVDDREPVVLADRALEAIEEDAGLPVGSTKLFVMIESARSVANATSILTASTRLIGLFFGPGDLTVDLQCQGVWERGLGWSETIQTASQNVVIAARAAGVPNIIAPALGNNIEDLLSVEDEARRYFSLGFSGVLIVTPRHIPPVNRAYAPTTGEEAHAVKIKNAFEACREAGRGVCLVDGQMVELPHYQMAQQMLTKASRK